MTTKIEQILQALHTALTNQGLSVERNTAVPQDVPAAGLVILRDGDPGEPERVLGGFNTAYYRHEAEIEIFVRAGSDSTRDTTYDALIESVRAALYADTTFGGLAYGLETSFPSAVTLPVEGGPPIKAGTLVVVIDYETDNPLS